MVTRIGVFLLFVSSLAYRLQIVPMHSFLDVTESDEIVYDLTHEMLTCDSHGTLNVNFWVKFNSMTFDASLPRVIFCISELGSFTGANYGTRPCIVYGPSSHTLDVFYSSGSWSKIRIPGTYYPHNLNLVNWAEVTVKFRTDYTYFALTHPFVYATEEECTNPAQTCKPTAVSAV